MLRDDFARKLNVQTSPLVGEYVRTSGTWWTDTQLEGTDYLVRLIAPGGEPTDEQIARFTSVVKSLPDLIAAANLEPIPDDDGWGVSPPPFDIHVAPISSIWIRSDDTYFLIFCVDSKGDYMLSPAFEISRDLRLISAEWTV